ncbi:MAG: c-type cytochrome [Gammaproteobacteria bacterium]|nr:c-type cytochrome [Gammaproteobacteria bacterium]NIR83822.1 c-type cytochrome [Gammaproteobacteria bacterium]NIV73429.1 c-type cytochrome [Gammaproteobacteria bacterium]
MALVACLAATAAAAPDGARLYARNCAACHGAQGRGGVGVPLALADFQAIATDEYLGRTIRLGRPGRVMPAFPQLSDAEVEVIVSHLRGMAPASAEVELVEGPLEGDPERGARLYQTHCASCHGADGEGGEGTGVTFSRPRELPIIAPALNNSGFLAAASDELIKTTLMYGREGTPMGSFLEQGLSERDIDDVVAYVRSFEAEAREGAAARSVEDEPLVLEMTSPYGLEQTVVNIKRAVVGNNFRLIRVQHLEDGLFPEEQVNERQVIVYLCNFNFLYDALALDPRVGLFLPCRVTAVEQEGEVKLVTINPKRLSALYNNERLDRACQRMYELYRRIMEEATL